MGVEQRLKDWCEAFGEKYEEVERAFKDATRDIGGEEMAEPKVVARNTAEQLHINFGDRFNEVAWKETDKVVVGILKGLAALGLSETEANVVMSTIARYAPGIAGHAERNRK